MRPLSESQLRVEDVNDSALQDMLDRVIKDFRGRVTPDQFETFQATDLRALKKELKLIQDDQHQTNELQNMRRIEPFLKRVEALGGVIHDLLGSNEVECLIWGSTRVLFRVSQFILLQPFFADHLLDIKRTRRPP